MKPKVFICHSSTNKRFVHRFAEDVEIAGGAVWVDEAEIRVGDSLVRRIEQGIIDAEFLVVVLSPQSVDSEWVRRELESALTREIAGRRMAVLPVLLEDCEIPPFLAARKYADFRDERHYVKSMALVLDRLGLIDPERDEARREISVLQGEISRLSGYVDTIAWDMGYSPDDEPEDDERGELDDLQKRLKELTDRYEEKFGEPYRSRQ